MVVGGALGLVLRQSLAAWSTDGSVVLVRGSRDDLSDRFASEGVTHDVREDA